MTSLPQKKDKKGLLIIESIEFSKIVERTVSKNNDSSGKITLPKDWIGRRVYTVLIEK